jgi:hypothetical protein
MRVQFWVPESFLGLSPIVLHSHLMKRSPLVGPAVKQSLVKQKFS